MLSSKIIVTTDNPNFEIDRISFTPGKFPISNSIGNVMNCSISSVARFREVVMTCTWLFVISGTVPNGICVME